MQEALPIAVDTAGSDKGVDALVEGALKAYVDLGVKSILVGKREDVEASLDSLGGHKSDFIIAHAPDVIEMTDSPARAVRRKPDSSLCVAFRLVKDGQASAVISAGHSGAMMAAGLLLAGQIRGIERAAIGTLIPAVSDYHPAVLLDSGANVDCTSNQLVQFAIMGASYSSALFGIERPRVALLSNGSESSKGTDTIRLAATTLRSSSLNYVGYVEGRDASQGMADVIVCDGFTGNVLLKGMEGVVQVVSKLLRQEAEKSLIDKIRLAIARPVMKRILQGKLDYSEYGGAPLLGLRELGMVLHGSSNSRAVYNALRVTRDFVEMGLIEKITTALAESLSGNPE